MNIFQRWSTRLLGRVQWNRPSWVLYLKQQAPFKHFWSLVALLCASVILYVYHVMHLEAGPVVEAHVIAPAITPNTSPLKPNRVVVDFGIKRPDGFTPQSLAPITQLNTKSLSGIRMKPDMPGDWHWESDSRLVFLPKADWKAGTTYTVYFDKGVLNPIQPKITEASFSTLPFEARITDFKLYHPPTDPTQSEGVATVTFNYPIDEKTLMDNTQVAFESTSGQHGERVHAKWLFDKQYRVGYLHTEALPIIDTPQFLALTLLKGLTAKEDAHGLASPVSRTLTLPAKADYFKIMNASTGILRAENNQPLQVFTLETSLGLSDASVQQALHLYQLPKDFPARNDEAAKLDYAWAEPGEITPDILAKAVSVKLEAMPGIDPNPSLHRYQFHVPTNAYLFVQVDKKLHAQAGFSLQTDYRSIVRAPQWPQEIRILHQGALLALTSEKQLSVAARGVPAVKIELARVLPYAVNQWVTQTAGDFSNPYFLNPDNFNEQNISHIFSEVRAMPVTNPGQLAYFAIDMGRYLEKENTAQGPHGMFLLRMTGWDKTTDTALDVKTSRLILVTDLGLIAKDNQDNTHDVYVASIVDGKPVTGVAISVLGKNGLPLMTQTSDANGHVGFPDLSEFIADKQPVVYLASKDADVSFMPYRKTDRQVSVTRFDVGGGVVGNTPDLLKAYVFSDRGVYRPGEKASFGVVVKGPYASTRPAGLPLQVSITSPRGTVVLDKQFALDPIGFSTLQFTTKQTSETGFYDVNVYTVKDNHADSFLGSMRFQVALFEPDSMRISTTLSPDNQAGWIAPTDLTATVHLQNLYGAPAMNRQVTGQLRLTPAQVSFDTYPDYRFVDPLRANNKTPRIFNDTQASQTTDTNGYAEFTLNLSRFEKATYTLSFVAEGFEGASGRHVTSEVHALVSPQAYFIGYKPDGDLSYIKQQSLRKIHWIAVNPALKTQSVSGLHYRLQAMRPVTTLVKKPDGTYEYQSVIQSILIHEDAFELGDKGQITTLPTDKIGDFVWVIEDDAKTELASVAFSVVGDSQLPLAKNALLDVKLNKADYAAGEKIELQITAPYTGGGLITLERDKVYAAQWFTTLSPTSVQTIQIPADFEGNGYVNVAFVRAWDSLDIFSSPLSVAIVPFNVQHDNRTVHIELGTPKMVRPGNDVTVQYQTDKPAKILVFAVDEGILQVSRFQTPDPEDFFFEKQALEVTTSQILDQILPQFKQARELAAVGGDGVEALLANHINPFQRKTDLPVVYWSGLVDSDSTAHTLTFNVPDYFNGELRVMAVAVSENAVGSTDQSVLVQDNIVIHPNVPTFVSPGDTFEVGVTIGNQFAGSGPDAAAHVSLSVTGGLEVMTPPESTTIIPEKQERTIRATLRATDTLGDAHVIVSTSINTEKTQRDVSLSVRPATPFLTTVKSGRMTSQKETLALSRNLYPAYRDVTIAASSSPLILITGLERYLADFPYGCTEQLVSRGMPLLAMTHQPTLFPESVTKQVHHVIQTLRFRQMSDGGFSYWPGTTSGTQDVFASVYGMHFLMDATDLDYVIPHDMFNQGLGYLRTLAVQTPLNDDAAYRQAYAIYLLTRHGVVTTNELGHLYTYLSQDKNAAWQKSITGAYIAATYALLQNPQEANRLISQYVTPKATTDDEKTTAAIADAQYVYLLAHHFPNLWESLGASHINTLVNAMNSDEMNTILSGYTSIALAATANLPQPATLTITPMQGKTLLPSIEVEKQLSFKTPIALGVTDVLLNNQGQTPLFYQLVQSGFDKSQDDAFNQGIEVSRTYETLDNKPVKDVTLGTDILVRITVRALNGGTLNNVAIVDLLPGGFDVVRNSVHPEQVDFVDVRDDRVITFASVGDTALSISYHINAVNIGRFTVPSIVAESMYDPGVKARGSRSFITVVPTSQGEH